MTTHSKVLLAVVGGVLTLAASAGLAGAQAHKPPKAPPSLRLYIFDCGVIHTTNGDPYSLKKRRWPRRKCPSRASWSPIPRGL